MKRPAVTPTEGDDFSMDEDEEEALEENEEEEEEAEGSDAAYELESGLDLLATPPHAALLPPVVALPQPVVALPTPVVALPPRGPVIDYVYGWNDEKSTAWRTTIIKGRPGKKDPTSDVSLPEEPYLDSQPVIARWPDGHIATIDEMPAGVYRDREILKIAVDEDNQFVKRAIFQKHQLVLKRKMDQQPLWTITVHGKSVLFIKQAVEGSWGIMEKIFDRMASGDLPIDDKQLLRTERDELVKALGADAGAAEEAEFKAEAGETELKKRPAARKRAGKTIVDAALSAVSAAVAPQVPWEMQPPPFLAELW